MRFFEFAPIKPIKPLTPAQSRIAARKRQIDVARKALKSEQELQKQQKERQRKIGKPVG